MKILKRLFNRELRLKTAFEAVRADIEDIDMKQDAFNGSANEWIIFLDQENRDLKQRIRQLENKLGVIEHSFEEEQLAELREL